MKDEALKWLASPVVVAVTIATTAQFAGLMSIEPWYGGFLAGYLGATVFFLTEKLFSK